MCDSEAEVKGVKGWGLKRVGISSVCGGDDDQSERFGLSFRTVMNGVLKTFQRVSD